MANIGTLVERVKKAVTVVLSVTIRVKHMSFRRVPSKQVGTRVVHLIFDRNPVMVELTTYHHQRRCMRNVLITGSGDFAGRRPPRAGTRISPACGKAHIRLPLFLRR